MNKQLILKSPIPFFLDQELDTYDSSKVIEYGIFYFYDKKYAYIQADLELFQNELKESIMWKLWVQTDIDIIIDIEKYMSKKETVIPGKLYSQIYFYQNTKGMIVDLVFEPGKVLAPKIKPKMKENRKIYDDYVNGVEKFQFLRWQSFLNN